MGFTDVTSILPAHDIIVTDSIFKNGLKAPLATEKKIGTLLSCSAKLFNLLWSSFMKERVSSSILLSTSLCFFLLGMQMNQSKLLL